MPDLAQQFQPGAPKLVAHGALDGWAVSCDGERVALCRTPGDAAEILANLRSHRAFAAEELRHVLSKQSERRA